MKNSTVTVIIAVTSMLTLLLVVVYTTAYYYAADHIFKDNMPILARIELVIESFLHYTRDYASIAVSLFIKQLEEAVVSKHKEITHIIARTDIQAIEDKYYSSNSKKESLTIKSKTIIISIEEGVEEEKEKEEIKR